MSEAFDAAWSVLKALPEQQMFREAMPRDNAAENPVLNTNIPLELRDYVLMDEYGARSYGTVHPAIASLLNRNPLGASLNLDTGSKDQKILDSIERRKFMSKPFWTTGRSIARHPEESMELYDHSKIGTEFDPDAEY